MRFVAAALIMALFFTANLSSANNDQPNDGQSPHYVARFEESECRFYYYGDGRMPECGDLIVPENRADPRSPSVKLHVAIFRAESRNPQPDPVIYLSGGPGSSALEGIAYYYDQLIAPFVKDRDFILFDQRGVGYSEPQLGCPELYGLEGEHVDEFLLPRELVEVNLGAVYDCQERLQSEGVNLDVYNSAASAADLNDLRIALGYDEWNLFGISYGTRLALTAMRDYPEGIRSVVLDSTYPPQASLYSEAPLNVTRALDALFDACAASVHCNAAYPNLKDVFYKLVTQLNNAPVPVTIEDSWSGSSEVLLTGDQVIGVMFQALYSEQVIPSLPRLIYAARNGDYDTFAEIQFSIANGGISSLGMYYSVQCYEEVPFVTPDEVVSTGDIYPDVQNFFNSSYYLGKTIMEVCKKWITSEINPVENLPVISDIPVLVMAGQYDPITPPMWGKQTSESLQNSFYFEYPGLGHGVSVAAACPAGMMTSFLDDPTTEPKSECIADMSTPFIVIGAPVKMIELETTDYRTVRPDGWYEYMPGLYNLSFLEEDAVLAIEALSNGEYGYYEYVMPTDFDLDAPANIRESVKHNGLEWDLYSHESEGRYYEIAVARHGGTEYIIFLATPDYEHKWLLEQVFTPTLESFVALD